MEIRLMKNEEVEMVRELMFSVLSRRTSKEYANSKSSFTVVAVNKDKVIGVATVFIHDNELLDEKTYFVSNLCVDHDYQRKGVATHMIEYIEHIGTQDGIKYVYTLVPVKYYETNKLYEKLDYDIKNINCYRREL